MKQHSDFEMPDIIKKDNVHRVEVLNTPSKVNSPQKSEHTIQKEGFTTSPTLYDEIIKPFA